MRAIFITFSVLLFSSVFAQEKCGYFGTMPVEKRRGTAPFSVSSKIILISFFASEYAKKIVDEDTGKPLVANDSLSVSELLGMKVLREFDVSHLNPGKTKKFAVLEMAELDMSDRDSLSRWFFNYRPKNIPDKVSINFRGIYTPRNAVLFVDSSGRVISYIEVCFECPTYYIKPSVEWFDKLGQLKGCEEKYEILKDMFRKKRIRYGVEVKKTSATK